METKIQMAASMAIAATREITITVNFESNGYDMSGPDAPITAVSMKNRSGSLIVVDLLWQTRTVKRIGKTSFI